MLQNPHHLKTNKRGGSDKKCACEQSEYNPHWWPLLVHGSGNLYKTSKSKRLLWISKLPIPHLF